jgi:hypothetical protein
LNVVSWVDGESSEESEFVASVKGKGRWGLRR